MAPISQSSHKGSSVFTHASQVLLLPNHMLVPVFNETERLLERMWNRNIVLSFRNSICYTPNKVFLRPNSNFPAEKKNVYLRAVFIGKPRETVTHSRPIQVHQSMRTKKPSHKAAGTVKEVTIKERLPSSLRNWNSSGRGWYT